MNKKITLYQQIFHMFAHELFKTLTAILIVARVHPGTSKVITDLLLPHPSSG